MVEPARHKFARRVKHRAAAVDRDRLARLREHGPKGTGHPRLSDAARKRLLAKLERLRATGSVKGIRRASKT
jgi:hypothetical protein